MWNSVCLRLSVSLSSNFFKNTEWIYKNTINTSDRTDRALRQEMESVSGVNHPQETWYCPTFQLHVSWSGSDWSSTEWFITISQLTREYHPETTITRFSDFRDYCTYFFPGNQSSSTSTDHLTGKGHSSVVPDLHQYTWMFRHFSSDIAAVQCLGFRCLILRILYEKSSKFQSLRSYFTAIWHINVQNFY